MALRPFTYQELWCQARIHRNILRQTLDDLTEKGIVFQHKYAIPEDTEFYGLVYHEKGLFKAPTLGHKYNLLNWSNLKAKELFDYYCKNHHLRPPNGVTNRKSDDKILNAYDKNHFQEEVVNLRTIRNLRDEMDQCLDESSKEQKFKELKFYIEKQILSNSIRSALELLAIGQGVLNPIPVTKDEIVELRAVIDFFISESFSVYDCFIRLSISPVHDIGPNISAGHYIHNYHLATIPYIELWEIMDNLGYLINPHCYLDRKKILKENRLKVFVGNPIDMLLVQIFSGIKSTKSLCDEHRFIIERYRNENKSPNLLTPSPDDLNRLNHDFAIELNRFENILVAMEYLVLEKIKNEVHEITDEVLEKQLESLLQGLIKPGGLGIDEMISGIKEYMKCFKNRKSLNDYLETFRKTKNLIERRRSVQGDNIKKKLMDEVIKSVESVPFLVRLSKLYTNYDARNLHEKLSDAALGSDKYHNEYSGILE